MQSISYQRSDLDSRRRSTSLAFYGWPGDSNCKPLGASGGMLSHREGQPVSLAPRPV
jgi:hypothetical protein